VNFNKVQRSSQYILDYNILYVFPLEAYYKVHCENSLVLCKLQSTQTIRILSKLITYIDTCTTKIFKGKTCVVQPANTVWIGHKGNILEVFTI